MSILDDEDQIPQKWMDIKQYIRVNSEGEPSLITIFPMTTEDGVLIPDTVDVYVDEKGPVVMSRVSAEAMIAASDCEPLEVVAQWKQKNVN